VSEQKEKLLSPRKEGWTFESDTFDLRKVERITTGPDGGFFEKKGLKREGGRKNMIYRGKKKK